ncbi:unnamed protein product, partial [Amoebophrya sp. A120]|eukprot:GSA120T00018142001.1
MRRLTNRTSMLMPKFSVVESEIEDFADGAAAAKMNRSRFTKQFSQEQQGDGGVFGKEMRDYDSAASAAEARALPKEKHPACGIPTG